MFSVALGHFFCIRVCLHFRPTSVIFFTSPFPFLLFHGAPFGRCCSRVSVGGESNTSINKKDLGFSMDFSKHGKTLCFAHCKVITMFAELEYYGQKSMESIGLVEPGSKSSFALEYAFNWLNLFFTCAFVLELLLRLTAFGCTFLKIKANWLDVFIVASSVVDVAGWLSFMDLTFLRLVRLTRLARLLKAFMMISFCEPLRILLKAVSTSFFYLFWSLVFLAILVTVASLFMTQVLAAAITDENRDLEMRKFIYTYYGTMARTTLTMFQILDVGIEMTP